MNNKIKLIIGAAALIIVLAGGTILYRNLSEGYELDTRQEAVQKEGETNADADKAADESNVAPDFTFEDQNGDSVALSDLKGKPVVLNFWASWCGPCQQEMPDFQEAYKAYGEDIQFIMMNLTGGMESKANAESFIAENEYTFPVYFDLQQSGAAAYSVNAIPTTYFIDKDGNIVSYVQGQLSMSSLEKGIDGIKAE